MVTLALRNRWSNSLFDEIYDPAQQRRRPVLGQLDVGEDAGRRRTPRSAARPPSRTPGRRRSPAGRADARAGRAAPAGPGSGPPSRARRTSWLAPPVSTTRLPASRASPAASSRARTISNVSSSRGRMILTTSLRGTRWMLVLLLAHQRDRQHLALVVRARLRVAVQRLQPFRMRNGRGQHAGDVVGHVPAADRQMRRVQQLALAEHRHPGRAAAHVDHGGAELALVLDQRREPGRHRRADQLLAARARSARASSSGSGSPSPPASITCRPARSAARSACPRGSATPVRLVHREHRAAAHG